MPINKKIYLKDPIDSAKVPGALLEKQRYIAKTVNHAPCNKSPNITPKRKGNEIHAKIAGLTSLYVGIP
jgi:hypothetical protein